jgi:AhpD family alkylhydroperoxidase
MVKAKTPLLGWTFNDVLTELHQIVFEGIPGETEPFELSELEREYIAFVLACYYQCDHCMVFHERAINRARKKAGVSDWNWKEDLISATLFLHLDGDKLSPIEWERWVVAWRSYARRIDSRQANLACYLGYAIGIARRDERLMNLTFESISAANPDNQRLKGVIRDIDGVVIFMKAATSKNRSDPIILKHLHSRGVSED